MGVMLDTIGQWIAGYLQKEVPGYEPFTPSDPEHLRGVIQPGDVLLVEGNNRISGIIKYLTQSTWSHAALYVGPVDGATEPDGEAHVLIEANIGEGVTSAPLSKYYPYHTRLCRPVGLSYEDRITVCRYAINRIGFGYDTKNIVDLMRYLFPLPVPQRWRRRMIAFGSGDPTKIICSALIAQAFDDPAEDHPRRLAKSPARNPSHPRFVAVHAARFRHLALFRNRQTHHRARLRLSGPALGRQAKAAPGGSRRIRCVSRERVAGACS
jgi:hypothetical protein